MVSRERGLRLAELAYWVAALLGGLLILLGLVVAGAGELLYVGFAVVLVLGGGALAAQLAIKRRTPPR